MLLECCPSATECFLTAKASEQMKMVFLFYFLVVLSRVQKWAPFAFKPSGTREKRDFMFFEKGCHPN